MPSSILLSKAKLNKLILSLSEKEFERVKSNIDFAMENRRVSDLEKKEELQRKKAFVQRIERMAEEEGIDVSDLLDGSAITANVSKKSSVPKKYRMALEDGGFVEWAGRGRAPKAFADALRRGESLESYLIQDNQNE